MQWYALKDLHLCRGESHPGQDLRKTGCGKCQNRGASQQAEVEQCSPPCPQSLPKRAPNEKWQHQDRNGQRNDPFEAHKKQPDLQGTAATCRAEIRSTKLETRSNNESRNAQCSKPLVAQVLLAWRSGVLVLWICFGFRGSDFVLGPRPRGLGSPGNRSACERSGRNVKGNEGAGAMEGATFPGARVDYAASCLILAALMMSFAWTKRVTRGSVRTQLGKHCNPPPKLTSPLN